MSEPTKVQITIERDQKEVSILEGDTIILCETQIKWKNMGTEVFRVIGKSMDEQIKGLEENGQNVENLKDLIESIDGRMDEISSSLY